MHYVILNGEVLEAADSNVPMTNRAFRYGDGLFETMIYESGEIKYFQFHWERLQNGMQLLCMDFEHILSNELVKTFVEKLKNLNQIKEQARIRLQVFREGEGLYTPQENKIGYLLEVNTLAPYPKFDQERNINAGFCNGIQLSYSSISSLKTCNSIPYVLAALERDRKGLEELILVNNDDYVAETCSSNIFWWDGETIFTPSLFTGCVSGVMRRILIAKFKNAELKTEEGLYPKIFLKSAKAVFTSNCSGIKIIHSIHTESGIWYKLDKQAFTNSPVFASIQSLF